MKSKAAPLSRDCEDSLRLAAEMDPVRERGHRIVHRHRMGVVEIGADLLEQAFHGGGEGRHLALQRRGRGRGQIAAADRHQPVDERGDGPGMLAVRPFGGEIDDGEREQAEDDRGRHLLVEAAEQKETRGA